MELGDVIQQHTTAIKELDAELKTRAAQGKLTDAYLTKWFYAHVISYVFLNMAARRSGQEEYKNQVSVIPNSYKGLMLHYGKVKEFSAFVKLAKYSKALHEDDTYQQIFNNLKQLLDQSAVYYRTEKVDHGWLIQQTSAGESGE